MKNIFVGNLSFNASEGSIRAMFEEFGTVGRVSIATDRDTGEQRGFAFVEMSVNAEGERAIEVLSGKELNGRALTVNEARPKQTVDRAAVRGKTIAGKQGCEIGEGRNLPLDACLILEIQGGWVGRLRK